MALSTAVLAQAQLVVADGVLKFETDKEALKTICRLLEEEANANVATRRASWPVVYGAIVAGLKECDRTCNWQTVRLNAGETDAQRQAREDQVYGMLASMHLLAVQGVRFGW